MGKLISLEDSEVRLIQDRIKKARESMTKIRDLRKKGSDAYHREPLGNEVEGRSRVTHSEVFNHVESIHPQLMKRYLATDHKVAIKGPDEKIGKALKNWARDRIQDQGGFRLINDVVKDGTIANNGTAKLWWSRIWGESITGEQVLSEAQIAQLTKDPEWQITSIEPLPPGPPMIHQTGSMTSVIEAAPMFRCSCTNTPLIESGPVIVPMPPEEFIAEKGKVRINDRWGCGHVRTEVYAGERVREQERLSSPGFPYYKNLKAAIQSPRVLQGQYEKDEREIREAPLWDLDNTTVDEGYSTEDLRRICEVVEWADYVVSGGNLVPAIVTFVNSEVVRVEENEDGIVPYCTWSPMVKPHSIFGLGVAWLHADDQNVLSVLTRAVLDSVAFTVDKPRMIATRSVDLLGLGSLTPGKLVVGREGDFKDIDVGQLDFRIFQAIEFLQGQGENRGPSTRYNMGSDAESLNPTATGVSIIQRASMNKVDMIALAFSELFLVDLYNKLIFLAQRNLDKPVTVIVDGEVITFSRDDIQGDYRATGDLGLDVDFDDRAFGKANSLLQMAMGLAAVYPMLYPVEAMREHARSVYLAGGERDVGKYLPPVPPEFKGWFPGKEQMLLQQMQMAQMLAQSQGGPPQAGPGGGPPPTQGGPMAAAGAVPPPGPQDMGSGLIAPEPEGQDFVTGQSTAQPDETMMEM